MSDIMYNDPAHWRKWDEGVAVHDDRNIKGFFGPYRWLSNFYPCVIEFEGLGYPSTENAYQAAKIVPSQRGAFAKMTAAESKKQWKKYSPMYTPLFWDLAKLDVMRRVVFDKFLRNAGLRDCLLATGSKYLEETNWWKDEFWGVNCETGAGRNELGKILMQTRAYWQTYS